MADCIFLRGEAFWLAEELSDPSPERSFVSRPGLHARDASSFWWRRTLCTFQHPPASGRLRPFIASRPLQAVPAGPRAIPVHPFLPGQGPVSVPSGPRPYLGSTRTSVPRVFPRGPSPASAPYLLSFAFCAAMGVLASPWWLAGLPQCSAVCASARSGGPRDRADARQPDRDRRHRGNDRGHRQPRRWASG